MEIIYKDKALLDIKYWKKSGNKQAQNKISELIKDIIQHPETGIGKPEQLKHELTGLWSIIICENPKNLRYLCAN